MDAILKRRPPTPLEQFMTSPLLFLAQLFYDSGLVRSSMNRVDGVRIVCISDTHNSHNLQPPLPEGDILIHAGDLTNSGTKEELDDVLSWLESQTHPHKVFIAGNHDTCLSDPEIHQYIASTYPSLIYLQETSTNITIRGRTLRVYGSLYTPEYGSWVFQYPPILRRFFSVTSDLSEYRATKIWSHIPPLTDILITHGPPFGHLDLDKNGCYALLTALWRIRPMVHVFGHIHARRGVKFVQWDGAQKAYEEISAGRAGWVGLVRLVWWKVITWAFRKSPQGNGATTVMINAASVGGFKNDQRKGAIMVEV